MKKYGFEFVPTVAGLCTTCGCAVLDGQLHACSAVPGALDTLPAPPALEPSMSAEECGNRLAGLWLSMQAGLTVGHDFRADFSRNSETIGRMLGLESAALALGPSVLAAFEKARGGAR